MRPFPQSLFSASADILAGGSAEQTVHDEPAQCFLRDLGYTNADGTKVDTELTHTRMRLLTCAAKLDLFALEVPDAPRMLFIGGRVLPDRFDGLEAFPPSSTSGISVNLVDAFESCVGEGIEYLSQLMPRNATEMVASPYTGAKSNDRNNQVLWQQYDFHDQQAARSSSWLSGVSQATEETYDVPSELCLRQLGQNTQGMSTGCAAGQTKEQATLSALLEIIERDAAAMWWEGGGSPRPISLEAIVEAKLEDLYTQAGRRCDTKSTLILDITTDMNIPCVAALSSDLETGANFACGLACRVNMGEAIRKAVHEMMQMELGHHVLAAKRRALGDDALNSHDKKQLERDGLLQSIWYTPMVQTAAQPRSYPQCASGISSSLEALLEMLLEQQLDAISVDLTRHWIDIPVVKAFIPGLQNYPANSSTPRLIAAKAASGGTHQYTAGESLL